MRSLIMILALILVTACKSSPPASDSQTSAPLGNQAQSVGEGFTTVLALTQDPVQFNDPKNFATLETEVPRLARFEHAGLHASAEWHEAQREMSLGNRAHARFLIRSASRECISCHAQTDKGPRFLLRPTSAYFNKLSSLDRAGFLFSVWSFDNGLAEFEKAMSDPEVTTLPLARLEGATLRALATAVRVKKDPALAEGIVTRIMYSKWAPVSLQMNAARWKAGIVEWKNSKHVPRTLDDAKLLISKAWTKQMESPRSGLVESLRASSLLHDLLAQKKPGKSYAETFYFAGVNSESLGDLDPFLQNETYFEACIKHSAHSEVAKNCYLRLESAVNGDYSAFEAMSVPQSARDSLTALRKLAEPSSGSWLEWGKGND